MNSGEVPLEKRIERDVADLQTRVTVLEMRYGDINRAFLRVEDLIRDQEKRLNALAVKIAVGAGGGASLVSWLLQSLGGR
jgi:phage-related minor tail protein